MKNLDGLLGQSISGENMAYNGSAYSSCASARDGLLEQSKEYGAECLEYGKKLFLATCKEENAHKARKGWRRKKEKYCCCCGDDFPIVDEPGAWIMGRLRSLEHASPVIRVVFPHGVDGSYGGGYLCGNCYSELTHEDCSALL